MNKEEIIKSCNDSRSPDSLRLVLERARNHLNNGKVSAIEVNPKPRSAQHYSEIYSRRLEGAKRRGVALDGLIETTSIFKSMKGDMKLYSVATIADEQPIYFWLDEESVVVGCVIG